MCMGMGEIECPVGSMTCLVPTSDPDNCGTCGNRCVSGLCSMGVCQAMGAGHVVLIGHDYTNTRSGINNIVGNAVFLSVNDPVRVLAYEGTATGASIAGANSAIAQVSTSRGRGWTRTVLPPGTTGAALTAALAANDVFLVYSQRGSSDADLDQLATDWNADLVNFVNAQGKAVVVLDSEALPDPITALPVNDGTYRVLLDPSGLGTVLLNVTAQFTIDASPMAANVAISVLSPGDAVAQRVPRMYRAEVNSVAFTVMDTAVTVTQWTDAMMTTRPVVLHKIF